MCPGIFVTLVFCCRVCSYHVLEGGQLAACLTSINQLARHFQGFPREQGQHFS